MTDFPVGQRRISVFNPIVRAYQTVAFSKGDKLFVLIVEDIQKDDAENDEEQAQRCGSSTKL